MSTALTPLALRRGRPHRHPRIGRERARAEDTIKIGVLHSLSGTMAISETILKDLMLMEVAESTRRADCSARRSSRLSSTLRRTGRCSPKRPASFSPRTR